MDGKYFNEGWFGKHPVVYEIASWFLAPIRRRAARLVGSTPLKILDIATGMGAMAHCLARAGHEVVGVDLDPVMLTRAKRKRTPALNMLFHHCDATRLPFDRHTFDAATVSFAMHDVPHGICRAILAEARRILRPGGVLLIVDYHELEGRLEARIFRLLALLYESPNYRAFVRRSTPGTLEAAGFRVVRRRTFLGAIQLTTAV